MCGIAGFNWKDKNRLKTMLDSIQHRGPDGEGMEVNEDFSIGMRRLAIIDPNGGWQPIYNEDKSICIVLNGEIYNYEQIWQELVKLGHKFSTDHSDTETVLHGYEQWGEKILEKLTGMFAFAIYDKNRHSLFIARDRLGIKPLYYHLDPTTNKIIFASEIKAILENTEIPREVNEAILYEYLVYRVHDSKEDTFFKGIKRLMPGHFMYLMQNTAPTIQKYWEPKYSTQFNSTQSDEDYAHEFYDIYKKVIKRHLIADVPVGVSLSGGLDSSGVVSVMRELIDEGTDLHTHGKLYTFSALFPGLSIDESSYIKEVETFARTEPVYAYPKVEEFWGEMDAWINTQEEPTISSAPYAYYSVYRAASKHVKVNLSGNGGDELLAGYIPYFRSYISSAISAGNYFAYAREMLKGLDIYATFIQDKIETLLPWKQKLTMYNMLENQYKGTSTFKFSPSSSLNERLMLDVTKYSTPNLLRYEDKNSMAFSIESRVPFLDHELVEYIFNLPMDQKIKNGWNRYVYRQALKDHMPEKNRLRRSKIGFTNPELTWMKAQKLTILAIFNSAEFKSRGYFNTEKIAQNFASWVESGNSKFSGDPLIFWRLLNSELWMRKMIDNEILKF